MPAPVGIGSSFQEDPDAVQVTINNRHIESRLTFDVNQVHVGSLGDQVGHARSVSGRRCDPQGGAGQAAAAPHRLLIDASGNSSRFVKEFQQIKSKCNKTRLLAVLFGG